MPTQTVVHHSLTSWTLLLLRSHGSVNVVEKTAKREDPRHKAAQEDGSQSQSQPSQKKPLLRRLLMLLKSVSMLLEVPVLLQVHGEPSPMPAPQLVPTIKTLMETACAHQVNRPTSQSQRAMLREHPKKKVRQPTQQLAVHPEESLTEESLMEESLMETVTETETEMEMEMGTAM